MNLKGFKKIHEDKHSTIMENPKGHQIKLVHSALPNTLKMQLKSLPRKMANGGDIAPADSDIFQNSSNAINKGMTGLNASEQQKMRSGQPISAYTEGTTNDEIEGKELQSGVNAPSEEESVSSEDIGYAKGGKVRRQMYADGTGDAEPADPDMQLDDAGAARLASAKYLGLGAKDLRNIDKYPIPASQQNIPAGQSDDNQVGNRAPDSTGAPTSSPSDYTGISGDPFNPPAPTPTPAGPNDPFGSKAYLDSQTAALGEQKQGALATLQNQRAGDISQANVEAQNQGQQAAQLATYQANIQHLLDDGRKQAAELAQHPIIADNYIKNMSDSDKISTSIGLILGGMGSAKTGGPNFAFNALQANIDRDIKAQQDNLGTKKSLLQFNLDQTQNLNQALTLTNIQTQQLFSSRLKQAAAMNAANAAGPAALTAAGQFDAKIGELQHNFAFNKALLSGQNQQQDPEQSFQQIQAYLRLNGNDKLADSRAALHVPGIGTASIPPPADVRAKLIARQDLANKLADIRQFADQNSGTLDPKVYNQGLAKAALVQDAVRSAGGLGVFREGEQNFVKSIAGSNPTQMFESYRSGPGYDELARQNIGTMNQMRKGYGLPQYVPPMGMMQKGAPQAPTGIRMMGGKPYRLDSTGKFMVPVK